MASLCSSLRFISQIYNRILLNLVLEDGGVLHQWSPNFLITHPNIGYIFIYKLYMYIYTYAGPGDRAV
jgi:hypothetical protein